MSTTRKMIFTLGTGRSGTCWVGRILGQHPEVRSFVEPKPVFDWVTHVAVNSRDEDQYLPKIFMEYERLYEHSTPLHFADKSHPAIWIAERLAERFPNSYFLGVTREVAPTVASMMSHAGVRRWCEEWEKYAIPNRFLGITHDNVLWYRQASIIERCTARWLSHNRELTRLQDRLKERFHLLKYEQLITETDVTISKLRRSLGLEQEFPTISPSSDSLTKWRLQLADEDVSTIESAIVTLSA
jgi:hypothetical protein